MKLARSIDFDTVTSRIVKIMNIGRSYGNVFRDLGFEPQEAESLRLRAQLMAELRRLTKGAS